MYRVIKFDKSGLNPVEIAEMKNGSVACRAAKAYSGQTGFKSSVIKFDESEHEIKSWDYGK